MGRMGMDPKEMAFELLTRPKSDFRLQQIQIHLRVPRIVPRIDTAPDIQRPPRRQGKLYTSIRNHPRIPQQIVLDADVLGIGLETDMAEKKNQHNVAHTFKKSVPPFSQTIARRPAGIRFLF